MNSDQRTAFVTRDALLKLLSDDEMASVSSAETAELLDGEIYLDLQHLDKGVCRAKGHTPHRGRMLPKRAVHAKTWNKIMAQLAPAHAAETSSIP